MKGEKDQEAGRVNLNFIKPWDVGRLATEKPSAFEDGRSRP
jgi:hypothetical protein